MTFDEAMYHGKWVNYEKSNNHYKMPKSPNTTVIHLIFVHSGISPLDGIILTQEPSVIDSRHNRNID